MAEWITSRQNPLLQHIRRLFQSERYRAECREYAADGWKLLDEAVRWGVRVLCVVASEGGEARELPKGARVVQVPADVMKSLSPMKAPQGVVFTCAMPPARPLDLPGGFLVLDGIQDPGNLGTILRTADALDVPVVLTEGCAGLYNLKTVRAAMGALFRTSPVLSTRAEVTDYCRAHGIELAATALSDTAADIRTVSLGRSAVVIGSEGQGVSIELLEASDRQVIIPMSPRCESLNAAIAAALVMWQMRAG